MSTRSTIGIIGKNKKVKGIYCHNDGYLSFNGVILGAIYNTKEKVEELVSMGRISSLGYAVRQETLDMQKYLTDPMYYARTNLFTLKSEMKDEKLLCDLDDFAYESYSYVFNPINNKWMVKGGVYWNKWIELNVALHTEYKRGLLTYKDIAAITHIQNNRHAILKYYPGLDDFMLESIEKIKTYIEEIKDGKYEMRQKISYVEFSKSAKYYKTIDNVYTIIDKDFNKDTVTIQNKVTKSGIIMPILNLVLSCFEYDYYITNPSSIKQWKQFN